MQIHGIYSIFDTKAKAYYPPFFLPNTDLAVRIFSDQVNDTNHTFNKHPEDYTLFQIGTFDDENAFIDPRAPELVTTALQLVQQTGMFEKPGQDFFDYQEAERIRRNNQEIKT